MAWTAVPTFTSGQILTAAQMNGIGSDLTVLRGDYATSRYSTADVTLNSTAWANLPAGPADLTLAALSGDLIEVTMSGLFGNEAPNGFLDVVTIVSSTVTNSFAANGSVRANGQGILSWMGAASSLTPFGGNFFYTAQAGDISSSAITLRLRYRTSTAANKTLYANLDYPLCFFARNHGPVEI